MVIEKLGRFILMLLAGFPVAATAAGAWAAAGPWGRADMMEARLIASVDAVGDLAAVPLGVQLRLQPGWKAYWRSPGDAGLPPRFDWSGSANLAGAEMAWPAPHRFTLFGIETFGYADEVVFPITAVPAAPGQPLDLRAAADLLVCSDICVPVTLDLALALPAGPAVPGGEDANLIARWASRVPGRVPGDGSPAGLAIAAVRATGPGTAPVLEVEATAREPFAAPDLFVEADPALAFQAPQTTFRAGGRQAVLRLALADPPADGVALAGQSLTLTLVDGERALETRATVGAATGGAGGAGAATGLVAMLATAFLGGLILNLMPCVLPVLSLKLLSVVSHGGAAPRTVRAGFLASAAGILFSFLVLAGALIGLKAAGAAVGWGIQFQQPLFLVFMTVLVTLFAGNLWGLFEVPLPRLLADSAERHGGGGSLPGHFATGAFATLLATPCSAPFLGTAVAFALSRGAVDILAVFATLALGMALPYLLVAAFPGVARRLPRPGRWMLGLRRLLGGILLLTALWLLSVLAARLDAGVAQAVASLMVGLLALLALRRRLAGAGPWRLASGAAVVLVVVGAFLVPELRDHPAGAAPVTAAGWEAFDEPAIAGLVAQGRTVFVDVTADWCITCQANKKLVLNRGAVAQRLAPGGVAPGGPAPVVAMRADWTRPDAGISAYLARFGRYGIPFDIVYGPAAPDGIVLPELLTEGVVLDALDRASGKR